MELTENDILDLQIKYKNDDPILRLIDAIKTRDQEIIELTDHVAHLDRELAYAGVIN